MSPPHAAPGSGVVVLSGEASAWGFAMLPVSALVVSSREALARGLVVYRHRRWQCRRERRRRRTLSGEASVARGTARSAGGGIGGGIGGGVESGVRRWRVGSGRRESNTSPLGILSSREGILSSRRSCCRLLSSRRLIVSSSSHRLLSCRVVSCRIVASSSGLPSPLLEIIPSFLHSVRGDPPLGILSSRRDPSLPSAEVSRGMVGFIRVVVSWYRVVSNRAVSSSSSLLVTHDPRLRILCFHARSLRKVLRAIRPVEIW